jgi:hypothetical protein
MADDTPKKQNRKDKPKPSKDKADAAVEAWVQELAKHFSDKSRIIRQSARAGLVGAGAAALPVLRKIAAGDDDAADIARMLIRQIDHRPHGLAGLEHKHLPRHHRAAPLAKQRGEAKKAPEKKKPENESRRPMSAAVSGLGVLHGRLLKDLNLTNQQKTKVAAILTTNRNKVRELLRKVHRRDFDREKMRSEIEKLKEDLQKDLKAVLTEEQLKKLDKGTKTLRPRGHGRPGRPPEAGPTKPTRPADAPKEQDK